MKMICKIITLMLVFSTIHSAANAVNLTDCGTLSTPSTTYVLQNNVVADGTCFTIAANNVTLDLNGKTVTYDNAAPIEVANGSFESSLSGTWDLTDAGNAARSEGAYLTPSVYDGDYAIKVTTPTVDQTVRSVGTVTLQPNTRYSISGMVYNQADEAITLGVKFKDTNIIASKTGKTWRGFQYIYAVFTTGESAPTYTIDLTVSGASSAPSGQVYFDDIRVQQSSHHGVDSGASDTTWARAPVIKNGTITQGQAHGDWSHAIKMTRLIPTDAPNYEISNITFNVSGNSSRAIYSGTVSNSKIYGNTINSAVDTIAVRDHYDGASIYIEYPSVNGEIYNNTITSGIQTGIFANSNSGVDSERVKIYGNNITLQSKYTNDFAITCYGGYGNNIYENIVNCTGETNSCRGIYMNSNGGSIHHNTVSVQYKANNQEYRGCGGSTYGIQIEDQSIDTKVYQNTVTAYADECEAAAFRYYGTSTPGDLGNDVYLNQFTAIATAGSVQLASVVRIIESYSGHLNFYRNTLTTNSSWLYIDGLIVDDDDDRSLVLDGNLYVLATSPMATRYYPLVSSTWADGSYPPRNVSLINNCYSTAGVESDLESGQFFSNFTNFALDELAANVIVSGGVCTQFRRLFHNFRIGEVEP